MKPLSVSTRRCVRCGVTKPEDSAHFYRRKQNSDGMDKTCAECRKETVRRSRQKPEVQANLREWCERNADRIKEKERAYREKNRDLLRKKNQARRDANPDLFRRYNARYRLKNPDAARQNARKWRSSEKGKAWRQKARNRIRINVNSRIWATLKGKDRGTGVFRQLGYTLSDLCQHLERQFAKGMTWANYGRWHVDHIVPHKSFNYSDVTDPEFRAAWALTNLRPVWASQNLKKGARREHLV